MPDVSLRRVDPGAVLRDLEAYARRHATDPNVVAVVLFGSFATGEYMPSSDADVLVVLRRAPGRTLDRPLPFMDHAAGVPIEPQVYTLAELRRAAMEDHPLLRSIRHGGRLLHAAPDCAAEMSQLFGSPQRQRDADPQRDAP